MSASPATDIPKIVSTDDAIELIWERVLSGEFADPAGSARDLWPSLRFSANDRDFLALHGLIELARREQRHTTRARTGDRPAIGWGTPHGKKWDKYVALTWVYESADGQKSLLEFNGDDLSAFASACRKLADAYARRGEWASETAELLSEHEVTRVRDLPTAVLAEVNAAALEAMGRQT